jgi:hypothetical protein
MGSDLHVWTQAICNAMEEGYRVRTEMPWIYYAKEKCGENLNASAITCYFPKSELQCSNDIHELSSESGQDVSRHKLYRARGKISRSCQQIMNAYNLTYSSVREAGIEYLFSSVSQLVQAEGEKQLNQVFAHLDAIPRNLITVHIRWGDKKDEMTLVPIEAYTQSVHEILVNRKQHSPSNEADQSVHIFLATEDPEAVRAFTETAPPSWNVYMDHYFSEYLPHRNAQYNGNPQMAQNLMGKPGLSALGSLLVAMEANDFVLTTQSNWSRLMNELRKTILEGRCSGCTNMIDLSAGEW